MNGFREHGLEEDAFAEKGNIVAAFDAFSKSKPQYIEHTSGGGKWTIAVLFISALLSISEFSRWWRGHEHHTFLVEKGVGHDLQVNMDIVVTMRCEDIHINVHDASGDRILAAQVLKSENTNWLQWVDSKLQHQLGKDQDGGVVTGEGWQVHDHDEGFGEEHVHDIIATARRSKKWAKTPKIRGEPKEGNSCRVFGSLILNKVQGDFHITARGHGYREWSDIGKHLDHTAFNFSHIINEFSFGAFYPSLVNPLDLTVSTTPHNVHKFQYFLSVVPTVYSVKSTNMLGLPSTKTIHTNQYAVTNEERIIKHGEMTVPGIFFKYDIEPLMLAVHENRDSFMSFILKIVNVLSGVLVAGHWLFTLSEWAVEAFGRRRRARSEGVLTGKSEEHASHAD